jgi:hypothetical protein
MTFHSTGKILNLTPSLGGQVDNFAGRESLRPEADRRSGTRQRFIGSRWRNAFRAKALASGTTAHRCLSTFLAGCLLGASAIAAQISPAPPIKDEFGSLVKMAPFVVNGTSLVISIYARTGSDRRYGEAFAGRVVKVVYEAVTASTGKGLVIIGGKGEPHPSLVFRRFLALAGDGKLDPAIAAYASEVSAALDYWEQSLNRGNEAGDPDGNVDLDFEKIFTALPLPLGGVSAKLYQLAWEEKFDAVRIEAALCALRPGDLDRRDRFKSFDWVFYLPPKGAFDRVLDELIANALKEEKLGAFQRVAVKSVLLVVKPKIRRTIETMREGLMFMTVVQAQARRDEAEARELTGAYIMALMPFMPAEKRPPGRTDHERAVNAVRARLRELAEPPQPPPASVASEAARPGREN